MKTKTLAFATLLLVAAFLFMQAIAPHAALAGTTWTDTGGGVSSYEIQSLAYDSGHNMLYAGTYGGGVWKYDGTTWTALGGGVSGYDIQVLAYDSTHNLLYAGCFDTSAFNSGQGVWKYDGTSWTSTGGGPSATDALTYDSGHNLLYAGGKYGGVWKYDGTSWTSTGGGGLLSYGIISLAYDSGHNLLYAGANIPGEDVWKYDGTSWTDTGGGLENSFLAYDSGHNLLYGAGAGHGVWKYDGTNWTNTGGGVSGYSINSLASDTTHNLLYAGCNDSSGSIGQGVWKFDGTNWTDTGGAVSSFMVLSLAYDSVHNLLYAGCYDPSAFPPSPSDKGVWKYGATTSSTFYFAEGYTGPNFAEYLCLGNPNTAAAAASVTYLFSDGTTKNASYSIPATGRYTVNVNNEAGANKEVSIKVLSDTANLVAERPMYFNYQGVWTGGSDVVGATSPNTSWYFAEGNTLPGFDEYVTVLNPTNSTANLTFKYMVEGSGEQDVGGSVGAHSRATFNTRNQIGANKNASLLLTSDQTVVAERPMYFNYHGAWTGGHDVVGANSPNTAWYLAEGTTRGGFEEWLCLQNPGSSPITVNARYLLGPGQGDPVGKTYTVGAKQRLTVSVNQEIGPEKDASIQLTSTGSFIAERPMYFNYHNVWTGGHDVLGANSAATTWFFAEGTTRDNFNEWLCLQNPGNADAHAVITYYTASGQAINKPWTISANSRLTVNANEDAGANQDISAKVSSDNPIIVERPMYFNYQGVWTGGHDVVGFTTPQ